MNKVDLIAGDRPAPPDLPVHSLFASALVGTGVDELKGLARSLICGGGARVAHEQIIVNERHHAALLATLASLREAAVGVSGGVPAELIALNVRRALSALGEMTGEVTTDEVLDAIFSRFCIGK
jgi:tRNA modification GTPase